MKPTLFLTGSKGFIGKHLLPKLTDYNVHCGAYHEVPDWIPDYIIHLAATTTTSAEFNPRLFEDNIIYAEKIMSIPTRIVYASSTSAEELTNPYAYTKRYIEYLGSKVNATGLRFFNVYGPNNTKGIVRKAIQCIKTGERLQLCGGDQVRDLIYIDDVVRTIIDNLDSEEKIMDVGTGHGMTIYDAMLKIINVFGSFELDIYNRTHTDMIYSVASPGIPGCLGFEEGLVKMKMEEAGNRWPYIDTSSSIKKMRQDVGMWPKD